eukprot:NODE_5541_length_308_cov_371.505792_g4929_i0.p1 GENE.NODE_5541_length_308_cov_371.505792_g4929_i0~~NODE_5541_length_308_cov_371.505792_g4929_i0.p1  ORF type:complete len:68 (-),score=3.89 NODE_5541_length_308_cov_371.505792_g4929_i0:72-275(-)
MGDQNRPFHLTLQIGQDCQNLLSQKRFVMMAPCGGDRVDVRGTMPVFHQHSPGQYTPDSHIHYRTTP